MGNSDKSNRDSKKPQRDRAKIAGKRRIIVEIIRSCLWVGFWIGFGYVVFYWVSRYAEWVWQPQLGEVWGSAIAFGIWAMIALSI